MRQECTSETQSGTFNITVKCDRDIDHIGHHQAFVPDVYKRQNMAAEFVWDTRPLSTAPVIPEDTWDTDCLECGIKVANGILRCFYCNFWNDLLIKDYNRSIRVNGVHYLAGGTGGYSGRKFTIEFFDGRPNLTTKSLWYQGKIPDQFQIRLHDNARFIGETP